MCPPENYLLPIRIGGHRHRGWEFGQLYPRLRRGGARHRTTVQMACCLWAEGSLRGACEGPGALMQAQWTVLHFPQGTVTTAVFLQF